VTGQQHPGRTERGGPQAAKHAPAPAVRQDLPGEHVLPDPGRGQQDALGFQIRPYAGAAVLADLVAQAECAMSERAERTTAQAGPPSPPIAVGLPKDSTAQRARHQRRPTGASGWPQGPA